MYINLSDPFRFLNYDRLSFYWLRKKNTLIRLFSKKQKLSLAHIKKHTRTTINSHRTLFSLLVKIFLLKTSFADFFVEKKDKKGSIYSDGFLLKILQKSAEFTNKNFELIQLLVSAAYNRQITIILMDGQKYPRPQKFSSVEISLPEFYDQLFYLMTGHVFVKTRAVMIVKDKHRK